MPPARLGSSLHRLAVGPNHEASSVSTRPGVTGVWACAPSILSVLAGRLSVVLQEGPVEMAPIAEARLLGNLVSGEIGGQQQMGGPRQVSSEAELPEGDSHCLSEETIQRRAADVAGLGGLLYSDEQRASLANQVQGRHDASQARMRIAIG